jgi:hypothetical protein
MIAINNYYEQEVAHQIEQLSVQYPEFDDADLSDVACIALNKFPPKYYRHNIDLKFYTSATELNEIKDSVAQAIADAAIVVQKNPRND